MPQSMFTVCAHMVWSTRKRQRFLDDRIRDRVHAYMAGILRNLGCETITIGGTDDHVHIVCMLSKTEAPARLVQVVKGESSKRVKTLCSDLRDFAWQRGYWIFSVSPRDMDKAVAYVEDQQEHHREMTFREEFMKFVRHYDVPHDERYMWE
jgi:REP element-mobilizing transposase RayT